MGFWKGVMRISYIVENTLERYPETRSSDQLLLLAVWSRLGFALSESQRQKFLNMPSSETIRRIRQKIQEQGKYPASENVRKHRKFKSMQVQQLIPNMKPDRVDFLINERLV